MCKKEPVTGFGLGGQLGGGSTETGFWMPSVSIHLDWMPSESGGNSMIG